MGTSPLPPRNINIAATASTDIKINTSTKRASLSFLNHAVKNLYRILIEKREPLIEEENIRILKQEELTLRDNLPDYRLPQGICLSDNLNKSWEELSFTKA